jgi:hypothetical protein
LCWSAKTSETRGNTGFPGFGLAEHNATQNAHNAVANEVSGTGKGDGTTSGIAGSLHGHRGSVRAELIGSDRCAALGFAVRGYAPICQLARKLIRAGIEPDRPLEAYRNGTGRGRPADGLRR